MGWILINKGLNRCADPCNVSVVLGFSVNLPSHIVIIDVGAKILLNLTLNHLPENISQLVIVWLAFEFQFLHLLAEIKQAFSPFSLLTHLRNCVNVFVRFEEKEHLLVIMLGRLRYLHVRELPIIDEVDQDLAHHVKIIPSTRALELQLSSAHELILDVLNMVLASFLEVLASSKI